MSNRFYQQLRNFSAALLVMLLVIFSGSALAASYSLPADFGTGAFSSCSGSAPVYNCSTGINLGNNDTVVLTSNVTLTSNGNLDVGKDVNISSSGFILDINVTGNVDIDKKAIISANIAASGDINIGKDIFLPAILPPAAI